MNWMVILAFLAVLSLFIPVNSAYSQSPKEQFTIQTIWVTGNKSCYHNDIQRLNEYHEEIILKYLSLYGIYPRYYPVKCMTEAEYDSYQPYDYTDLLIVIYNKNIGRDVLHANNMGGYFQTSDYISKNGLKIVVCECEGYNFNDAIWVLSHELAHFSLFYLGLPKETWVDWVHNVQTKYYRYCPDGDTTNSNCNGLWQKYEGTNRNYKVMKVNRDAYGHSPPQVKFVNYVSTQEKPQNFGNENNNVLKELQTALDDNKVVVKTPPDSDYRELAYSSKIIYQDKLNELESGIKTAESSLSGLYYTSPDSQKKIQQAWDKRYYTLESFEYAKAKWNEAQNEINKGNFKNAVTLFNQIDWYATEIGNNLTWISAAIYDAENMEKEYTKQDSFCFLIWCW